MKCPEHIIRKNRTIPLPDIPEDKKYSTSGNIVNFSMQTHALFKYYSNRKIYHASEEDREKKNLILRVKDRDKFAISEFDECINHYLRIQKLEGHDLCFIKVPPSEAHKKNGIDLLIEEICKKKE